MKLRLILFVLIGVPLMLVAWAIGETIATPVVRQAQVRLAGWPAGTPPVRALLMADIHVAGPDMPPERLARIVRQVNALAPDIVLIAGDFVSDKRSSTRRYEVADAIAPLRALKARLGVVAVLGNHDHWRGAQATRAALRKAGVTLLENDAARVGPLAIGGVDDDYTGRADLPRTLARLRKLDGARLLLSHSPDVFPDVPPDVALTLAGHTHCGQISPPFTGPLTAMSRYGDRYACGLVREGGKTLIVTGGIGTSILPLRFNVPPELWLVELRGL